MKILFNDSWTNFNGNESFNVSLPFDAMLREKRDVNNPNKKQAAYFCGGIYTFTKELEIKKEWLDKRISIFFEGVYNNAKVFINDEFIHENKYGYIEFEVDITNYVRVGNNVIKVIVDNSLVPCCRWYSGAGIYRDVNLIISDKDDIKDIKIITKSIEPAVINVSSSDKDTFAVSIFDKNNKMIYQGNNGDISLKNVDLWDIDNPILYTLRYNKNDEVKFGIRKVSLIKGKGLFINDKKVLLRGGCIHADNGLLGTESYKESEYRKVYKLKQEGFNAIRMAHNPCSRYILEACDELGMYILDEAFDGWYIPKEYHDSSRYFYDVYEYVLTQMVNKDFNHPSVIMYSFGNEVSETAYKEGVNLLKKMNDIVKNYDSSRPVTCGINLLIDAYAKMGFGIYKDKGEYKKEPLPYTSSKKENKSGSSFFNYWTQKLGKLLFFVSKWKMARVVADCCSENLDILGLNYGSGRYEIDAKRVPDRFMLGTETFVEELFYNWNVISKYPSIIGDFVWAAWDYLGEAAFGDWTYPSYKGLPITAGSGAIDLLGNNTAEMEYMKVVWGIRKDPYIGVFPLNHKGETPHISAWRFTNSIPSNNWQPFENDKCKIEIFSLEPYVELFINNKSLGKKKTKNARAYYSTRYKKGTLTCYSYDLNHNKVSESTLVSGEGINLSIKFENNISNENNIKYLDINFVDNDGNILPYIEEEVKVDINGTSLSLKGLGSAISVTDESYLSNKFTSYRGSLLAIFKVEGSERSIVNVTSKNGLTASLIWEGINNG